MDNTSLSVWLCLVLTLLRALEPYRTGLKELFVNFWVRMSPSPEGLLSKIRWVVAIGLHYAINVSSLISFLSSAKADCCSDPQVNLRSFFLVVIMVWQILIQPKNDSSYCFWVQKVLCPNSTCFSLSVLSKTVENENFN